MTYGLWIPSQNKEAPLGNFTHCQSCGRKLSSPGSMSIGLGRKCQKRIEEETPPWQKKWDDNFITMARILGLEPVEILEPTDTQSG
jgi:hypothetical protein